MASSIDQEDADLVLLAIAWEGVGLRSKPSERTQTLDCAHDLDMVEGILAASTVQYQRKIFHDTFLTRWKCEKFLQNR